MTRLNDEQLINLFHEPRTVSSFTEEPVTDEQLRRIQELTFYGPTAFNSQPLRITWVKSPEARERLVAHLADGNKAKTQAAPVTAILSADANWVEHAETFNPNAASFIKGFYTTEELATPAAELSAHLQAGYFITAIRALGLDAGPMTGADFAGIKKEFFADNAEIPFLVVNIGHGVPSGYDRPVRFTHEEATRSV
ncbi:malonic semialdehyde reductase [Rothia mucilaginosa]